MRRFAIWVPMVLVLSGCAGDSPVIEEDEAERSFEEFDLEVTDETGIIRGIVVDETITPIEGATVTIKSEGLATATNLDGAFGFDGLDEGVYFLDISHPLYITTQQSATVTAGEETPPIMKVRLAADPTAQPYTELLQFNGYIACSFTLVLVSFAACGLTGVATITGNSFLQNVDYDQVPEWVQSEMVWESTQSLGDTMSMSWTDPRGGQNRINGTAGESPLITTFERDLFEEMDLINATMWLRAFSTSREGTDIIEEETWNGPWRGSVYPVLNGTPVVSVGDTVAGATGNNVKNVMGEECVRWVVLFNACMGAGGLGATLEQGFEFFTTSFFGFRPMPDWWFVHDGVHPPP